MLSLEDASFRHAGAAAESLRDITLTLAEGTLTGVLGASGSGLSTLCLVLGGLAPRVLGGTLRGTLRIDAADATDWPTHQLAERVVAGLGDPAAQLSLVAETVFEEAAYGPANLGLPRARVLAATQRALKALGIDHLADRDPRHLSGGEQQLVVLAALLAMGSRHLVLDAPLGHLDPANRARVLAAIEAAVLDGKAVLVAEHRRDVLPGRLDVLLHLAAGRLVEKPAAVPGAAPSTALPGRAAPAAPDIVLEHVSHVRAPGVPALDGIDLAIQGGEAVAIVGPNGSGKTTLVQHLDGLLRPSLGRVLIGGEDAATRSVAQLASRVAVGFQDPGRQIFARSLRAEVAFGPRQLGRARPALERAVERSLAAVGLEGLTEAHPADLGTSQRKLLAIASLLAMESPVLVLDEPTAGLDDAGVATLAGIVQAERAAGRTVIVVSHDERFVAGSFDRAVRLERGRVTADGSPASVLAGLT